MASTAFEFDLQQEDNLVNLFDGPNVSSPESVVSNSSCEEEDILQVASKVAPNTDNWLNPTELNFDLSGLQNSFFSQPAPVPTPVQTAPAKQPIKPPQTAKPQVNTKQVKNEAAEKEAAWQNSLFANSFMPPQMAQGDVSQMFESFLKELSPKPQSKAEAQTMSFPPQAFLQSPFSPFVNMNINSFNMMGQGYPMPAVATPAPVATPVAPVSPPQSSPVKTEKKTEARKNRAAKRRRDNNSNSNSPSSPPSSSDSGGEGNEKEPSKPTDEKEVKRQKRLIKNRESAQASRERKKLYVQGLEKKLSDASNQNTALNNRLVNLEEENRKLRERLLRIEKGEDVSKLPPLEEEPLAKKRRIAQTLKLPLPPKNQTTMNPFTANFWRMMMQQGQAVPVGVPAASVQQGWVPPAPSRGVVLFIMMLCVALLVIPKNGDKSSGNVVVKTEPMDAEVEPVPTKISIGRQILGTNLTNNIKPEPSATTPVKPPVQQLPKLSMNDFVNNIKERFEEFEAIKFDDSEDLSSQPEIKKAVNIKQEPVDGNEPLVDDQIDFQVNMDKGNLMVSLPTSWTGAVSDKTSVNSKVVSISRKLLKDICQYLE